MGKYSARAAPEGYIDPNTGKPIPPIPLGTPSDPNAPGGFGYHPPPPATPSAAPQPQQDPSFQSMLDTIMAGFAQNVSGLKSEFAQSMDAFRAQSEANLRSLREKTALDEKRRKEEIVLLQRRLKDRSQFREGAGSSFGDSGSILAGSADILGGGSGKTLIGA